MNDPKRFSLLEQTAAMVLMLVMLMLGWVILAAYRFTWLRLPSLQLEVLIMLVLLVSALLLVSVVALRHTRR